MSLPTYTGNIINHNDFNEIQSTLENILGVGQDGYGIPSLKSNPVNYNSKITAFQWNDLLYDVNALHEHITGAFTSTQSVVTGTTVVNHSIVSDIYHVTQSLIPNRYTAHPSQFLISDGGISTIFYNNGDSLRTLPWGIESNVIRHKVVTQFPSAIAARYYFNLGCYLTYTPYYEGTGLNDLDTEWANFIDYLRAPDLTYIYDRDKFVTYDSITTNWTSGTLHVSIQADRAIDFKSVEFTITYQNDASPNLLISPAVGTYTITL